MKRSAIIFIFLISLIAGFIWYGYSLPQLSHITLSQSFNRPTNYIWKLIFEFQNYPKWRENIYAVEKTTDVGKHIAWKEINGHGVVTPFQLINFKRYRLITLQETGENHLNSGKWHFQLTASDDKKSTTLTITEDRLIPNPLTRAINYLFDNRTKNIDSYFRSINNKLHRDEIKTEKEGIQQN